MPVGETLKLPGGDMVKIMPPIWPSFPDSPVQVPRTVPVPSTTAEPICIKVLVEGEVISVPTLRVLVAPP